MFGAFDDGNGMMTDAWSDRLKTRQDQEHHSIVARTLLTSSVPTQERKKKSTSTASTSSNNNNAAMEIMPETDHCDSYPNTNTSKVDWALLAAHRVASILSIKVNEGKKTIVQEKNLATIFFAKPAGERFKDEQRFKIIERLTLESILLAIFLPTEIPAHLGSLASQHSHLRLAARQCTALVEQNQQSLSARGARERDLLIKRILFHADNGKTECTFVIDAKEFNQPSYAWSEQTLESVREPDLFGRAIGVLVHDVLQSPSLRVKAGALEKQFITLILSWANALENIKTREDEIAMDVSVSRRSEDLRREERHYHAPPPPPPPQQHYIDTHHTTNQAKTFGKSAEAKKIAHPLAEEEATAFF